MNRWLFPFLFVFLATPGCGAKSMLEKPLPRDGGGQGDGGSFDGGVDAGPHDAGPSDAGPHDGGSPDAGTLHVDCGPSVRYTTPRRAITLQAHATSPDALIAQEWTLAARPMGSAASLISPEPSVAVLTPDVEGSFLLAFRATDTAGREARCEVEVQSVVGPPVAICPEEALYAPVGTPLEVMGDGFDDDAVVSYEWTLVSSPPGPPPTLRGADSPTLTLVGFTRGAYVLRLTVTDVDGAVDHCEVTAQITGPPEVSCDESAVTAPTRRPVTLRARATDDVGIASRRWEVLARPPTSTASPMPANLETTTLTPDRTGRYRLRFTATDVEGQQASCEVTVDATPTPPDVTCPARIETAPLTPVSLSASAVDDGTIVRWAWAVASRPPGSAAAAPSPPDRAMTNFTPDIAGVYTLRVTATDDDGLTGACTTTVSAGNIDGLRVEMFWNVDRSDMDLHLLNPTGTHWRSDDSCFYGNCRGSREWGAPGDADNPRLDIDDTNGFGPENINIRRPQPGTYRIAVHAFRGDRVPNRVTVRVYCGGSTTTPRQTFGPVTLRGDGSWDSNDFWRVADVDVTASGCTIHDLSRADGPWIEPHSVAVGRR